MRRVFCLANQQLRSTLTAMQEDHTAERLLTAIARGETAALQQLFTQTAPKLFAITSRVCRNRNLAEQALEETFTSVWRRASAFDPQRGTGMAWLSQIARNRAVNVENRTPVETSKETNSYQVSTVTLPDLATARIDYAELDKLMASVDKLDDKARQALLHAYYEATPRDELAKRLDISAGVLTKNLRRGLNKLTRALKQAR